MNCQLFETLILEATRGGITEACQRKVFFTHAEACDFCAARLADETALTDRLRALAAVTTNDSAPPHVEEKLRAAFRQHRDQARKTTKIFRRANVWSRPHPNTGRAAAAAVIAVIGIGALTLFYLVIPRKGPGPQASIMAPNREIKTPPVSSSPTAAGLHESAPPIVSPTNAARTLADTHGLPSPHLSNRVDHVIHRTLASHELLSNQPHGNNSAVNTGETEIATDFLPMGDASDLASLESGQIVRVKLPRSSLASFGLPLNFERAGEPVKADVMLGEDGRPRAIRFIR